MPFYGVHTNHIRGGVYESWEEAKREIHKTAKYKKFATREEAEAFAEHGPFALGDSSYDIAVYTDGACRNNGKKNAVAGYGIFFKEGDARNESRRLEGAQTNNAAELTAVLRAVELLAPELNAQKRCAIFTDSAYALHCCGNYGRKCAKAGWKDRIPNEALVRLAYERVCGDERLVLVHVTAHTNNTDAHSLGNRAADALATGSLG